MVSLSCGSLTETSTSSGERSSFSDDNYAVFEKIYSEFKEWFKKANAVSKAWQCGADVDISDVREILDEGVAIEGKLEEVYCKFREGVDVRDVSYRRRCEQVIDEVRSHCLTLRGILEVMR